METALEIVEWLELSLVLKFNENRTCLISCCRVFMESGKLAGAGSALVKMWDENENNWLNNIRVGTRMS